MDKKGHWYTDKNGKHYFVEEDQSPKEGWEQSNRRKMINNGKYVVDEGDGSDPREVSKEEYDGYEADESEFDETVDDDFGFDEEEDVDLEYKDKYPDLFDDEGNWKGLFSAELIQDHSSLTAEQAKEYADRLNSDDTTASGFRSLDEFLADNNFDKMHQESNEESSEDDTEEPSKGSPDDTEVDETYKFSGKKVILRDYHNDIVGGGMLQKTKEGELQFIDEKGRTNILKGINPDNPFDRKGDGYYWLEQGDKSESADNVGVMTTDNKDEILREIGVDTKYEFEGDNLVSKATGETVLSLGKDGIHKDAVLKQIKEYESGLEPSEEEPKKGPQLRKKPDGQWQTRLDDSGEWEDTTPEEAKRLKESGAEEIEYTEVEESASHKQYREAVEKGMNTLKKLVPADQRNEVDKIKEQILNDLKKKEA